MTGEYIKNSFVARLWLESKSNGDTIWRGHLQHVQTKEEEYFQDLMEMREFLARVSGVTGPPLTTQPFKDTAKLEALALSKLSANFPSETVTIMRPKTPLKQPTSAQFTNASTVQNKLQSDGNWGSKLFFSVLFIVLMFFWWLVIYSGGVVVSH